jgi:hypothetical protein
LPAISGVNFGGRRRFSPRKVLVLVASLALAASAFYTVSEGSSMSSGINIFALSSSTPSGFIFGVSGLSGTNLPSTFVSEVTSQYQIVGFRMPSGTASSQLSKYTSNGAKYIYVNFGESPTDNPQTDAQNLVAFLKAYPQVNAVGLANEPNINGWTPQQYAPFLIAAYNAIKSAGLPQKLCAFEASGSGGSGPQSWIQGVLSAGGQGHYDMACIHIYPPKGDQSSISSNLDAVHSIVGTSMMITESNIANCPYVPNVPNPAQAMESLLSIYESKSYIKGVFWYDLVDSGPCGLFASTTFTPNQQAKTYQSVISSYMGTIEGLTTTSSTTSTTSSVITTSTTSKVSSTTSSSSSEATQSSSSSTSTSTSSATSSTATTTHGHGHGHGQNRKSVSSSTTTTSSSNSTSMSYQSMLAMLATLSPNRESSAGYGFLAYAIFLTGGLIGIFLIRRVRK